MEAGARITINKTGDNKIPSRTGKAMGSSNSNHTTSNSSHNTSSSRHNSSRDMANKAIHNRVMVALHHIIGINNNTIIKDMVPAIKDGDRQTPTPMVAHLSNKEHGRDMDRVITTDPVNM